MQKFRYKKSPRIILSSYLFPINLIYKKGPQKYLSLIETSIRHGKIIAQLRLYNKFQPRIRLGKRVFSFAQREYCEFCHLRLFEPDSLYHLMIECTRFNCSRQKISERIDFTDIKKYCISALNNPSNNNIKNIVTFIEKIVNYDCNIGE